MPIFMTHPEHGATHVGSGEVAEHEKNGWKQDTYDNWMESKRVIKQIPTIESNKIIADLFDLRQKYIEKFGSAPHHKKSAETLRKELE